MSVRNTYSVLVDGNCVFSGSKAMCDVSYQTLLNLYKVVYKDRPPVILIAYAPKGGV